MKVKEGNKRKDVSLAETVIKNLQALADKKGYSLKRYMEISLIRESLKNVPKS